MFSSSAFNQLARAFHQAHIRYVVVGGLAVVAHGYVRLTVDIDLVLDFANDNCTCAMEILHQLGYRPRVPVTMADFAKPINRHTWATERQMVAFTVLKDGIEVDLLTQHPFDFPSAYADARWKSLGDDDAVVVPFVDLQRLIDMKQRVGRPKDLLDIEHLRALAGGQP